jgi:hypothetical protein
MDAAMNEIGRRAVTQLPRQYKFSGLHAGHRRLYERMARELSPLYRFDRGEGLIPTPLAYANYVGQHAVRGAGLGGTLYALTPDDAQ